MIAPTAMAALWFLPFVVPIAAWVAWSDLARMRIPNVAVLALLAVFLLIGPLVLPLDAWAWRWTHFAAVLALGFVLNALRAMGAGDAKFAAAMAPFVALQDVAIFAVLFAALLLSAFVAHRLVRAVPRLRALAPHWESWHRRDFPMGLPLAVTLVAYLALVAAGPLAS
jgi:prepilin peptidase CpaA